MKPFLPLALVSLGSASLAWLAPGIQEGGAHGARGAHGATAAHEQGAQDLGATFQGHCGHCHVPPDVAFEVDRAWLEQVRDTA